MRLATNEIKKKKKKKKGKKQKNQTFIILHVWLTTVGDYYYYYLWSLNKERRHREFNTHKAHQRQEVYQKVASK